MFYFRQAAMNISKKIKKTAELAVFSIEVAGLEPATINLSTN